MAAKPKLKWLTLREGIWYYERRVPDRYKNLDPRSKVRLSCETSDFGEAVAARERLNRIVEDHSDCQRFQGPALKFPKAANRET
ncbi:hypothetical protein [Aureimonas sp. AU20]|uniref:hypothetical protein n=1 Tax=Aureimonas sp. AU20 TaxID=1349819 RepID=UPI00071FC818|nr:hypothetical protein [Aureimonas sp. AU20]ALN71866.1 hypothetical protein M673_04015 [Aureimonas sp. AU20]